MRITAWNCNGGTADKVPELLDRLRPDVTVVPESAQESARVIGEVVPHVWAGELLPKGLGVYAPGARELVVLPPSAPIEATTSLAVRATFDDGEVDVVGVWTQGFGQGGTAARYRNALLNVLEGHAPLLDKGRAIVAGDLNYSAQQRGANMHDLLTTLRERYGLRSAYHSLLGCAPGDESDMTLWWRGDRTAGFHCDLVLVPEA